MTTKEKKAKGRWLLVRGKMTEERREQADNAGRQKKGLFPSSAWSPPSLSSPPRWSPLCLSDIMPAGSAGRLPFTPPRLPPPMSPAPSYTAVTMVTGYCGHACQAAMLFREDRHRWSSSHSQSIEGKTASYIVIITIISCTGCVYMHVNAKRRRACENRYF